MPPKTKTAKKSTKPAAKKPAAAKKPLAKAGPVAKKITPAPKKSVKPVAKKTPTKGKAAKAKAEGLMETVKKGVQTGLDAMGDLVKKITPDALKPIPKKGGRK